MKRLRKEVTDLIDIQVSKENNQVQLRQKLKYKSKKCDDCDRVCPIRRVETARLHASYRVPFWGIQCNVCRQFKHPTTGKFNTSFVGVMTHYCGYKKIIT
jgi:epoxyqueuosine reductase QueG